jgi:hypothetical protein
MSFVFGDAGLKIGVVRLGRMLRTVLAVPVLFPSVLSFGEETVALLLSDVVPVPLLGAVTTIVIAGAAPGARFPPVRLQVTVPDTLLQLQLVPVALTNETPAGSVSTTLTAEASSGPAFATLSVYVRVSPRATGSGESVFVSDRFASPAATVRDPPVVETD